MAQDRVRLEPGWKARVGDYLQRPDMQELSAFLRKEKAAGKHIFPPGPRIFSALDATPFDQVKVVILGQDPYHGAGQAHGLCFSVLPLNSVLTVEEGRAGSHQGKGWEGFTDAIVQALDREKEGLVFMLWGAYAQAKGKLLQGRHCVLRAPHPSPLSAHRGFLGCGHFSKANRWLQVAGKAPVDWSLPRRDQVEALLAAAGPGAGAAG